VVRVARFRSGIAVVVLAGGLVVASGLPALAAPAVGPTVTIAAKSLFRPVTGDIFVVFNVGRFSNAQIHGSISGATAGQVARLFVQPFPFKNAPTSAGSLTLTGPAAPYSFTVTPTLATRYQVELFATIPLRTSAVVTVFVANKMTLSGLKVCSRPVCRQRIRVQEQVPASTLRAEISKRWFFYFGLNLSPTTTPPPPRVLTLDTRATISRSTQTGARTFVVTISWSFRIGRDGFNFNFNFCNKDTEATDGLGLPGHHGCGNPRVSASAAYLG
jgi:hypothetical protein